MVIQATDNLSESYLRSVLFDISQSSALFSLNPFISVKLVKCN